MLMRYNPIIIQLLEKGVINKNGVLSSQYTRKLNAHPNLLQKIIENTSFLKYNAPLNVRIKCIVDNIRDQPRCLNCNNVVIMSTSGSPYRKYKFPTFCSPACSANYMKNAGCKKNEISEEIISTIKSLYLVDERFFYKAVNAHLVPYIIGYTDFLPQTSVLSQRLFHIVQDIPHPIMCANCGIMPVKWKNGRYLEYCSTKCSGSSSQRKKNVRQTVIEKYGVDNVFANEDIKSLIRNKLIERYNVDNPSKSAEVQEKKKASFLTRYGVDTAVNIPHVKDKIKQPNLLKYGNYSGSVKWEENVQDKLLDEEWLAEQHHQRKKSHTQIAKDLNISPSTVDRYCKKYEIQTINHFSSTYQDELYNYIAGIVNSEHVRANVRDIIPPFEIDILVNDVGIEVDGVYWHSEIAGQRDRSYHVKKRELANQHNIHMIQIWSNEWINKPDIVKSRLSSIFGKNNTIYARETNIRTIDDNIAAAFFNETHIQGHMRASIYYGLYKDSDLVAAMSFGKSRYNKGIEYELIRFSNQLGTTVVGGASKLFKYFIRTHNPSTIISYSDRRWNTGLLYNKIGFEYSHTSASNYWYFRYNNPNILFSRVQFQKHKLSKLLENFDPNQTEWENMVNNGYDRIWDCGNDVFIWTNR